MTETPASPPAANPSFWTRCAGGTPRDRANARRLLAWTLGWALAFLAASRLLRAGAVPEGPAAWAVAAVPTIAAIFVARAYARFLREADELQRMIHTRALALGFGGGWIAISAYALLERVGAPPAGIADGVLPLAIFFSIGIVSGSWRYR